MDHLVDLGQLVDRTLAGRSGQQTAHTFAGHDLPLVLGDAGRIASDLGSRLHRAALEAEGQALRITAALVAGRPSELRLELSAGAWQDDITFAVAGAAFPSVR